MGIDSVGLIGVLLNAKNLGIISRVMPLVDDLRDKAGFWISDDFYVKIRSIAKE